MSSSNPFGAAIKYCLRKKKWSQEVLAKKIDRNQSTISDYIAGRRRGREPIRRKIAKVFGYSYDDFLALGRWILEGKDPEEWGQQRKLEFKEIPEFNLVPEKVPIISWEDVKAYAERQFLFDPAKVKEWTVAIRPSKQAFGLKIRDISMEPEFTQGDIIIIDPSLNAHPGEYVLALIENTELPTLKSLQVNGDKVLLVPRNERFPVQDITGRLEKAWPVKAKHREYIL